MRGIIILFLLSGSALAQDVCPPDRLHRRQVVEWGTVTCTLLACMGRLVCPADGPCHRVPEDCNKCTGSVPRDICLTDAELSAATRAIK